MSKSHDAGILDTLIEQPENGTPTSDTVNAFFNVGLNVQIVLGSVRIPIQDILSFGKGSVIELDRQIDDPVDVIIENTVVARAELVKLGEDRIGVKLIEIVKQYKSPNG